MIDSPSSTNPSVSGYDIMVEFLPIAEMMDDLPFLSQDSRNTTIVVLASGLIEKFLRMSLISLFRTDVASKTMIENVFEGNGPLATFSSKIEVCAGLGNIDADARHDLKIIKKVRNAFAHSPRQLHLKDFSACLSLKLRCKLNIQDDCREREMFKHSCGGVVGKLSLGTLWSIAAGRVISTNKDAVSKEYASMIQSLRTDEARKDESAAPFE
ncbi:MltR family transcriptional regulator [Bradyrhizobium sp. CW10]|uniref:MltR family transcriptional regulator n=1 Tax=Bradyrhizobium sp. CW10 TaxID=2782683 RepID=UPI001FFB1ED9|nr:MltR family transcriptional regulator [Bradyrhizobium sp. CW10]MCK1467841.1 hypothetical protein [Bradyrhizobium sp. CW10]